MFEEPLHLIPRHLRKEFEKMLGVHIEGDLCPVCRYRLKEEYGGALRGGSRSSIASSRSATGVGIGVVPPVDPNNQDTSVLIGSEDISKLDLYSRGRPARARSERRAQRRQPRHGRVHRGLQERDRVPARHDHRDAGEGHSRRRAGTAWSTSTP